MSDGVRGRVMIINMETIMKGSNPRERLASEYDYLNLSNLFKDLGFDIVKTQDELTNLTARVCLTSYGITRTDMFIVYISELAKHK